MARLWVSHRGHYRKHAAGGKTLARTKIVTLPDLAILQRFKHRCGVAESAGADLNGQDGGPGTVTSPYNGPCDDAAFGATGKLYPAIKASDGVSLASDTLTLLPLKLPPTPTHDTTPNPTATPKPMIRDATHL